MFTTFYFRCIASLILIVYCSEFAVGLFEGDNCTFKDGSQGKCKFLTDCQPALQLLQTGVFPENICGFEGTQSIVCCKDVGGSTGTTTTTTTTTTQAPQTSTTTQKSGGVSITNRSPGKISREKCKQYAEYAYDKTQSPTLSIIPHISNTLECAFERLPLIVGGTLATRQEFPHMALIGYKTGNDVKWACGGSLISENFVLTAGHCLKSRELGSAALVRVGLTNQSDPVNMQERTVSEVIAHPEYGSAKYHDIGLLRLSQNVICDIYSRPACLQTETNIPYNNAIASGWGKIEFSGQGSNDLLKVILEFFSVDKCNKTYKRDIIAPNSNLQKGILEDLMICAGSSKELKDTCQGDSGGPLQVYHDDSGGVKCMYDIVGVTSFGKSCGLAKNVPGVYTRVSAYLKWIEDTVWPNALVGYESGDGNKILWYCGGSLISENFILTAAHCLKSQELGPAAYVRLGITNKSDINHLQHRKVAERFSYPEYINRYHDIGLLKLSESVELDTFVRPACLQIERYIPFKKAIVSGWGKIGSPGPISKSLLKIVLEFFDIDRCNDIYMKRIIEARSGIEDGINGDIMICAGSSEAIRDTCEGDSGGPLQVYHNDADGLKCMYDIIGVTAFGMKCGLRKDAPGIYTRVSSYIKWIEDIVWPN